MREPKRPNNQKINVPVNVVFADRVGVAGVKGGCLQCDAAAEPSLGLGGWAPQAIGWSQFFLKKYIYL
jgi:hypothetical protein